MAGANGFALPLVHTANQLTVFWDRAPFIYLPGGLWVPVLAAVLIVFCPDSTELVKRYFRPSFKWALLLAGMFVFSVLHFTQVTAFLYFQF